MPWARPDEKTEYTNGSLFDPQLYMAVTLTDVCNHELESLTSINSLTPIPAVTNSCQDSLHVETFHIFFSMKLQAISSNGRTMYTCTFSLEDLAVSYKKTASWLHIYPKFPLELHPSPPPFLTPLHPFPPHPTPPHPIQYMVKIFGHWQHEGQMDFPLDNQLNRANSRSSYLYLYIYIWTYKFYICYIFNFSQIHVVSNLGAWSTLYQKK